MRGMRKTTYFALIFCLVLTASFSTAAAQTPQKAAPASDQALLEVMHSITSQTLYDYLQALVSEKFGGRLTGTPEYGLAAQWVSSLLKKWGVEPAGDNGTYLQAFPNPYTQVLAGDLSLHVPLGEGKSRGEILKSYRFEDEFIPGGTSGSGEVKAEVVYAGYGITAPELGYDDYKGVDVKGKIVLLEREVPVDPGRDPEVFKKWRPYSFHQYKLENAADHGAKGMIYNYGPIGNPNNAYRQGFVYSHVGDAVVGDIFAGTGRKHADVAAAIARTLKPQSFATGKVLTIKNVTEHHPDGIGASVLGLIRGTDPVLKDEVIIIGGHLDFLGRAPVLMTGANDNGAAVAVMLGLAEAMTKYAVKPRRSVLFAFFGAEEQAVNGSRFYTEHPLFPMDKTMAMINMEAVGAGDKFHVLAGTNFPGLTKYLEQADQKYIHRVITASPFANNARPRQDVTWFLWKGVPGVTLGAYGGVESSLPTYHNTRDNLSLITPVILEDTARLLFLAVEEMAGADKLDFRTKSN
jgi:hypothetical protein